MADDKLNEGHETQEGVGTVSGGAKDVEEARRLHHLATADPEPERDGLMTGPAHEAKYGLERAADSEAIWRGAGVHPTENRALVEGEDGAENLRGLPVDPATISTADASSSDKRTAAAPRASGK